MLLVGSDKLKSCHCIYLEDSLLDEIGHRLPGYPVEEAEPGDVHPGALHVLQAELGQLHGGALAAHPLPHSHPVDHAVVGTVQLSSDSPPATERV